jgi:hypothetical protein
MGESLSGLALTDYGAPGRSRTYNPQIRSLMLYPLSYGRTVSGIGCERNFFKKYTSPASEPQGEHKGASHHFTPALLRAFLNRKFLLA